MYQRLARFLVTHAGAIIGGWVLCVLATTVVTMWGFGTPLFDRLSSNLPQEEKSSSYAGFDVIEKARPGSYTIIAAVDHLDFGTDLKNIRHARGDLAALPRLEIPNLRELESATAPTLRDIAKMAGVKQVVAPFYPAEALLDTRFDDFVNDRGSHAAISVTVDADDGTGKIGSQGAERIANIEKALRSLEPKLRQQLDKPAIVSITHHQLLESTTLADIKRDLVVAESVGIPLSVIIMIFVFGGVIAALMPTAAALVAVSTALAVMFAMTYIGEQQSFAVNVISILGLGLSIDYGLLILSRYREEILRHAQAKDFVAGQAPQSKTEKLDRYLAPLAVTMATAGRTVLFSAITVAVSIIGMLMFTPSLLRSLGIAGMSVVVLAAACALTLVPALAFLAAPKLCRQPRSRLGELLLRRHDGAHSHARWHRLGTTVNRHPWPFLLVSVVLLTTCVIPVSQLQLRNSMLEMMPLANPQRQILTTFKDIDIINFAPIEIVAATADPDVLANWGKEISDYRGVRHVSDVFVIDDDHTQLNVSATTSDRGAPVVEDLVKKLRANAPVGTDIYVTGQAAQQLDFVTALGRGLPGALTVIIGATLILLFAMTRSIVVPIKALLINSLSLVAALGISTWVFQDGHGVWLLGAEKLGGLESYVVVMMLCIGFGLSMDYEVFLLARMRETYVATGDNDRAVVIGLARSGRIITSAAGILVCVFLAFCLSSMIVLKQVGFVMAVAVALDATIVRLCLVPSLMTLFGNVNWWAPKWLRGHRKDEVLLTSKVSKANNGTGKH